MVRKKKVKNKKIDKFVKLYPLVGLENKLYPTDEKLFTPEIEKATENLAKNYFGFFDKDTHERKD